MEPLDDYITSLEKAVSEIEEKEENLNKLSRPYKTTSRVVFGVLYILLWIFIIIPSKEWVAWIMITLFYGTALVWALAEWVGKYSSKSFIKDYDSLPFLEYDKNIKLREITMANSAKKLLTRIIDDEYLARREVDRIDLSNYRNEIENINFKNYGKYEFDSKIYDPATKILNRIEKYTSRTDIKTTSPGIRSTSTTPPNPPEVKPETRKQTVQAKSSPEPKPVVTKVYPIITNLLKLFSTEKTEISKRNLEHSRNVGAVTQGQKDYFKLSETNAELGLQGEIFVIEQERSILIDLKRSDLANKIEHTSKDKGDHYGYDIISFDQFGNEKYIEVKTTTKGVGSVFYITDNELFTLSQNGNYFIYRVYNFDQEKKSGSIYVIDLMKNDLLTYFNLEPIVFAVKPNILVN